MSQIPIPARLRPSPARAAAAARLTGGPAEPASGRLLQATGAATAGALAVRAAPGSDPATPEREPGRPRHLRVVEPPTRTPAQRRRRARALLVGAVGLAAFVGFALVYLHVVLAQRQFRLDRLNTQVQSEQSAYQDLRLQVAQLGSPQHVISTAEGQLGMVQPAKVLYLTPTGSVPAAATAAAAVAATPAGTATPAATTGSTAATTGATGSHGAASTTTAPAGDADWPRIKSQLAGTP